MKDRLRCVAPAEYTNVGPCSGEVKPVTLPDNTTVNLCDTHLPLYINPTPGAPVNPPTEANELNK